MRTRQHSSVKSLGDALRELIDQLGIKSKIDEYEAVVQWSVIVGEQISKVTTATKIQKGVLIVKVSNGPWRNELLLRKEEIKKKLNTELGQDSVKDIKFV